MKMFKTIVTLAIVFFTLTSCAQLKQLTGTPPFPECNQNISDDSVLKKIAVAHELCLEDIGNTLIIANAMAIGRGVYTREQAREVVQEWIDMLNSVEGVSYKFFREEIYKSVKKYPGLFEICDIHLVHFRRIETVVLPVDRELLTIWLENRIMPTLQEVE